MTKLNMVEAINLALDQEMKKDKRVIILGEDVGIDGGVFRVTDGLFKKHGKERVIDTPLSESGIVGTSIGLAAYGMRPVAEIQFEGFMTPAFDQLISHASRIRNRSRGRYSVPMVVRAPYGGAVHALEHHSEAPEAIYAHVPGLKVVIPSSPYDAKGLLISAIRDPDPVIFFEPKKVYRAVKEEVPEEEYAVPIGKARVVKEGNDISIITFGSSVRTCLSIAQKVEDVSIEVIDLRTISPLDDETILNSVKKTGRALIVHEAPRTLGVGAEISATINENLLSSLKAPVKRITGYDIIIPLPPHELMNFPHESKILKGLKEVMTYGI
jgi:pyruvate dehydrogenase E1 component beta subunit